MSSFREQRTQAQPQRHIVFLCVPPLVELDLIGPLNVFEQAARPKVGDFAGTPGHRRYRITLATAGRDLAMAGDCGVTLMAHKHYSEITDPIDTLIVASGTGCVNADIDPELCDWLQLTGKKTRRMCSICVGVFVLAAAGLLNERRAATHWSFADALRTRYLKVQVDSEPIWVKDGYMYTTAGMTAGIDLALALVEEDLGSRIALQIARLLVVFLKRPGGQRQFSVPLRAQSSNTKFSRISLCGSPRM